MPTITTSNDNAPIDLDSLLSHMRRQGIAVGNPEMQRLHAVFAQAPTLSRNELRHLLIALLAKDAWQRTKIGRVYDRLVPFDPDDTREPSQSDGMSVSRARNESKRQSNEVSKDDDAQTDEDEDSLNWKTWSPKKILAVSLAVLLALLLTIIAIEIITTPKPTSNEGSHAITLPEVPQKPIEEVKAKPGEKPLALIKTIDLWIPHVETRPRDPWPQLLPALLLLLGSGLGFCWLLYKVLEVSRPLKAKCPKKFTETGRFHVAGVSKPADYHLLNGEQRRDMRWGVSRYQSEQLLNRLNIPLSVQHSASAGMPQLVFERNHQEREVWLWQDLSSSNSDLSCLVEEINHTLQRANINVQRGYFRGLPSTVNSSDGEVLWSNRHEYPETEPLVLVFSDADKVAQRQYNSPEQSERTLKQLSHWPLLCFVDSSQHAGTLQRLLHPHAFECILPPAVADWLANQGQSRRQAVDECVLDSLHQWAAACALPNRVIMEDEMRALHNALGLDCAWHFHSLARYAKVSGRGFDFRRQRTRLLNELPPNKKAVEFWIARNNDLDKALIANQHADVVWEDTKKQRLLARDTALLKLWLKPDKQNDSITQAVKALYDLYADKKLQKDINRELSHYTCKGFQPLTIAQNTQQILLPFAWHDLTPETQRQLVFCGFGGAPDPNVKLCWDNVTRGVLAGLAAMMVLSMLTSLYLLLPKPADFSTRLDSAEPAKTRLIPYQQGEQYLAATYKSIGHYAKPDYIEDHQALASDQVLTVSWQRQAAQAAQFPIDKDNPKTSPQHWLLGTVAQPQRPNPEQGQWPDLSVVVIFGEPSDMTVRKLAAKLLDTGSADQVLIGKGRVLRAQHAKLLTQSELIEDSQWIYINGPVLAGHGGDTSRRVASIRQSPLQVLAMLRESSDLLSVTALEASEQIGEGLSPLLQAQKEQILDKVIRLENKLTLIKILQGRFEMGSNTGDSDEKPVHTVTFNYDFWMSQHEITFEQYDAYIADRKRQSSSMVQSKITVPEIPEDEGWGRGSQPVINVNWNDVQGYVKWLSETNQQGLQCRLPSETEWEYAARAGSITEYPWGDDVGQNNANCDGCGSEWDNKQTAPVGRFKPNAFGLHDMHGNVWEWVQDPWHSDYKGTPSDGRAWEVDGDASVRVLRGGSWNDPPDPLRSAYRFASSLVVRSYLIGFRIVCSSH